MLEIEYRNIKNKGVEILRCYGQDSVIELPDNIQGEKIIKIGDYMFSIHKRKEDKNVQKVKIGDSFFSEGSAEMLCGNQVKTVFLPKELEEIGRYVFYGCVNLKKLKFTDSLLRTGTGIFTGCKLQEIELDFYRGKKSALKDIVSDTRFPVKIHLNYHEADGMKEAHLYFPEYYEEAVENTPARIIENYFNGTGYKYRQCFFRGEVDYQKYDALFMDAEAIETEETICQIAFGRLLYPLELSESAREQYLKYVRQHQKGIAIQMIQKENMDILHFMGEEKIWEKECLNAAIDMAAQKQKTEILSFFMNEKNRLFPKKKKTFEL